MADVKEPLVLFLIGMRINTLWRVWEWFPAFLAMPTMIVELYKNPELGFLKATHFSPKPATGLLFLSHDQN